jgi:hypothetical protein
LRSTRKGGPHAIEPVDRKVPGSPSDASELLVATAILRPAEPSPSISLRTFLLFGNP